jgi:ATP phosphoribosyltransferase regulatory subunit
MPALGSAIEKFEKRLSALDNANVDLSSIDFEASYGRTSMEYYDGFVFGFYSENHINLPPIATGGRYDALTKHIGKGREIPAVGGVVRPDLIIQSKGFEDND